MSDLFFGENDEPRDDDVDKVANACISEQFRDLTSINQASVS